MLAYLYPTLEGSKINGLPRTLPSHSATCSKILFSNLPSGVGGGPPPQPLKALAS